LSFVPFTLALPTEAAMHKTNDRKTWLLAIEAAAIAELPLKVVMRLGRIGVITTRRIPGTRPMYSRADVESLASDYTFPRTSHPPVSRPAQEEQHAAT
jgi:hypothetical protein